jgi:hypothetical protein
MEKAMRVTPWTPVCLLAAMFLVAGCAKPGQEPGDDPTRNDESPGEGRPIDPQGEKIDNARKRVDVDERRIPDGSDDEPTKPEQ